MSIILNNESDYGVELEINGEKLTLPPKGDRNVTELFENEESADFIELVDAEFDNDEAHIRLVNTELDVGEKELFNDKISMEE